MKKLFLMRHGKAKKNPGANDAVRPLTTQGIKMSALMASSLKKDKAVFDTVISSPAIRALETAYLMASPAGFSRENIVTSESLYNQAIAETLVKQLSMLDNKRDSVLVVGHDPSISRMASAFLPGFMEEIPPSGVLALSFDRQSWGDIQKGEARFVMFKIIRDNGKSQGILKIIRKDLEKRVQEVLTETLNLDISRTSRRSIVAALIVARRASGGRPGRRRATRDGFFGAKACPIAAKVADVVVFVLLRAQISPGVRTLRRSSLRPAVGMLA